MKNKPSIREQILEQVIKDTFYMARRYAHGRNTYAPGIVRDAYHLLKANGIEIKHDATLKLPKKNEIHGMTFRSDYLDDIN